MDFLRKLHEKEGKTIIMVTHDEHVAKNADRIEYLKDGKIIKTINIFGLKAEVSAKHNVLRTKNQRFLSVPKIKEAN